MTLENGKVSQIDSTPVNSLWELYRADRGDVKLLTVEQEKRLGKMIQRADFDAVRERLQESGLTMYDLVAKPELLEILPPSDRTAFLARNILIERNTPLVDFFAKRFVNRRVGMMDLIAAGNTGLVTAAETFDPEKGKFSTHASFSIVAEIHEQLASMGHSSFSIPRHAYEMAGSIQHILAITPNATAAEIAQQLGKDVTAGMVTKLINRIRFIQSSISLDEPIETGEDSELAVTDTLVDPHEDTEVNAADNIRKKRLIEEIGKLGISDAARDLFLAKYYYSFKFFSDDELGRMYPKVLKAKKEKINNRKAGRPVGSRTGQSESQPHFITEPRTRQNVNYLIKGALDAASQSSTIRQLYDEM